MSVAEVTVRFAGTILEVAHVRPGECFRIGTAPGVELPLLLAGITAFPIVDATTGAFVVRRPAGTYATRNALPMHEPDARLAPSDRLELWLGNVLVTVELTTLPATPVAKPPLDRRPPRYLAGSLVAHLVMWSIAIAFAAPMRIQHPRPRIQAHLRPVRVAMREPERPPPPKPPEPIEAKPPPAKTKGKATKGSAKAIVAIHTRSAPDMFARAAAEASAEPMRGPRILADLIGKMDVTGQLAQTGPRYDPDAEHQGDFGKGPAFDPDTRSAFDTIKTGPYQTISTGAAAGAHYSIEDEHARVHVRLCDDDGCTAEGGLNRQAVDYRLMFKLRQFASCYQADTEKLTLELVIGSDGKVRDAHGPGKAGSCVAKVASAVTFPAAHDDTRASYSVVFVPPT
jgi:hypothetical protein